MGLREYRQKRDFARTPEPAGSAKPRARSNQPSYLIQKHAATRLHYDFRLEMDGVLKSWALPKGPSLDPMAKRLAVHVEDHPIEYGGFEGVIPKDEYGGGTVMLWDRGWWEPVGDPASAYAKGDFKFILHGEKLKGRFVLVRMRKRNERERGNNWLLIKERDAEARPNSDDEILREDRSVATDRAMAAIAADSDRVWSSKGKGEQAVAAGASRRAKEKPAQAVAFDGAKIAGAKRAKAIPRVTPQLASAAEAAPDGDQWLHEIKYDGYRLLAAIEDGAVTLKTRNDLDWTKKFPELAKGLARLRVKAALLDGEVVHLTSGGVASFSELQADLADRKTAALHYVVFDLLYLDGWDLTKVALETRKSHLKAIIEASPQSNIRYSDHQIGEGPLVFANAARLGLEGIVSKRRDALYRPGRGGWLKVKSGEREELIIVGFTDPAGARQGLGALLVGYRTPKGELVYAGRVGTGYSDKLLAALRKTLDKIEQKKATVTLPPDLPARGIHWVKPALVAEVSFSAWTADGMLRAASFQGLRDDKAAEEVVIDRPAGGGRTAKRASAPPDPAPAIGRDGAALVAGVKITHAERVLYPEDGVTKLMLAQFYAEIADWVLPHVARRPLSLLRCPEGIAGEHFFQKHMPTRPGDGIIPVEVASKEKDEPYLMIEDRKGLLALAQMSVVEIHPWGSTIDDVEKPDRIFFDLDPDEGLAWDRVIAAALEVRATLDGLGLTSFAKTTGGKGLHVVVPLKPSIDWDEGKEFSRRVATKLAGNAPDRYTATLSKKSRAGRIFIDYLRNGRGQTAVAAYSTRAKRGATVSTPLSWDEVERGIRSDHFTVKNLPQRLRSLRADPWAEFARVKQKVSAAMVT